MFKFNVYFLINIVFLSVLFSGVNEKQYSFDHISFQDGLSQVIVTSIIQDSKGFIWIGTFDGLNRYDGKNFVVYKHDPDDDKSISSSDINTLLEDKDGNLWIGTRDGLNMFDMKKEIFVKYKNDKNDQKSLSNNNVFTLFEDVNGLWVGTRNGLNLFKKEKGKFKRIINENNKIKIRKNINELVKDNAGNIWIGSNLGLEKFNIKTKEFFMYNKLSENEINKNVITALYIDNSDKLWVGTLRRGLFYFDKKSKKFMNYKFENKLNTLHITTICEVNDDELWIGTYKNGIYALDKQKNIKKIIVENKNPYSLDSNSVSDLFRDRNGLIWIGTSDNGVNIYDPRKTRFISKTIDLGNKNNYNVIWGFAEQDENILWIATGEGLVRYDNRTEKYSSFTLETNDRQIQEIGIQSFIIDRDDVLWIGKQFSGLYTFDKKEKVFTKFKFQGIDDKGLLNLHITSIFEDSSGKLWLSTIRNGVMRINEQRDQTKQFISQPGEKNSISSNTVFVIKEDIKGNIWFGTEAGLNMYDPKTGSFKKYINIPGDRSSINSNIVASISINSDKTIWVGTTRGFCKFSTKTEKFTRYSEENGYLDDPVYEIIEDNNKKIWLAGNRLSRFDPEKNEFMFFNEKNDLVDGEFNSSAVLKSKYAKNLIYFGSTKGYNVVDTDRILKNKYSSPIEFTKILVNGKEFKPGNNQYLKVNISDVDEISLPYKLNNIILGFIALDYSNPLKNKYAYKINGVNEEWIHIGKKNEVVFTNLTPGSYELLIKGSNSAGMWNKEAKKLTIVIKPPFWMSLWFKGLLLVLLVFLLAFLYRKRMNKIEEKYQKENTINKIMFKYNISKREREIINLVVKGKSSKEIEDELYISLSTVNNHIYSILKKMDLKNRGELIVLIKTS